jgi:hypothetical protein
MNLNSKYFDRIRINPEGAAIPEAGNCEWRGCPCQGGYRAPKGRMQEGKYFNFCIDHVREYNKSYNYFAGMRDDDILAYQRSAETGHRPTWHMGMKQEGARADAQRATFAGAFSDPFGFFRDGEAAGRETREEPEKRPLKNLERRCFLALDLDGNEPPADIKARYKALVKRLHPDANGGDRSSEDRLRQIIQAYHYLKSAGFC